MSVYLGNFDGINEKWLWLWRWHFFHPYDLVLVSETPKKSKLCHIEILKCNFCLILQRGHLLFFFDLKTNYDHRFMKEDIFLLLLGCPMTNFGPLLIANIFFVFFSSMLFLFPSLFSYFYFYFLTVIKSGPLVLNLRLFSFFHLFYLH